jgi:hypothetical protein
METNDHRLIVEECIGGTRISVSRLSDASRVDEPGTRHENDNILESRQITQGFIASEQRTGNMRVTVLTVNCLEVRQVLPGRDFIEHVFPGRVTRRSVHQREIPGNHRTRQSRSVLTRFVGQG